LTVFGIVIPQFLRDKNVKLGTGGADATCHTCGPTKTLTTE